MSASDVLNLIKEKNAKFVDLRFCDTRGKEQHVTLPAHAVDEEALTHGEQHRHAVEEMRDLPAGWVPVQNAATVERELKIAT